MLKIFIEYHLIVSKKNIKLHNFLKNIKSAHRVWSKDHLYKKTYRLSSHTPLEFSLTYSTEIIDKI